MEIASRALNGVVVGKYAEGTVIANYTIGEDYIPIVYTNEVHSDWSISATQSVYVLGSIRHIIWVDDFFFALPYGAKKFMILHEVGHIIAGDSLSMTDKVAQNEYIAARERGELLPMEKAADEFAISKCSCEEVAAVYASFSFAVDMCMAAAVPAAIEACREFVLRMDLMSSAVDIDPKLVGAYKKRAEEMFSKKKAAS